MTNGDGDENKLTEYRLKQLEAARAEDSKWRREVTEMLNKIDTKVEVQRAKTSFLGAASGAAASLPALIFTLLRGNSGSTTG